MRTASERQGLRTIEFYPSIHVTFPIQLRKESHMKKLSLVFLLLFVATGVYAQTVIYPFETAAKDSFFYQYPTLGPGGLGTATGYTKLVDTTANAPGSTGTHAMKMRWFIDCDQSWGGWQGIAHYNKNQTYLDLSSYTYLTLWYNIVDTSSVAAAAYMRFRLYDPGSTFWSDSTDHEEWYFQCSPGFYSRKPGWQQLKIPLSDLGGGSPDSTGFHLPGWSGKTNNSKLDFDRIVGWDLEVNCDAQGTKALGSIMWDDLQGWGLRAVPFVYFTGKADDATHAPASGLFVWGGASMVVVQGAGPVAQKNAIQWTQASGWSGGGHNLSPPVNLRGSWPVDSLKFKMKADTGAGTAIRVQFESGANGKKGIVFTLIADNQWHNYSIPLRNLVYQDGTTAFDSSAVTVFQFLTENDGVNGKNVYITDVWTGNPVIDVIPPDAPKNLKVAGSNFTNVFSWDAVTTKPNLVYNAYFRDKAWTSVDSTVEDLPPYDLPGTTVTHVLRAPNTDQNVTYYYGVITKDAAGNLSTPGVMGSAVTTKAKGVPTIAKAPPANFKADGDLSEWSSITPFVLSKDQGTAHVNENGVITNDADCSAKAWLATDANNLYVAFDVTDDYVMVDTTGAHGADYMQDCPDLFIGLYDWRGPHHFGLPGGTTPDYHVRFSQNRIQLDGLNVTLAYAFPDGKTANPNYIWMPKITGSGYIVEAKISYTAFASASPSRKDKLFKPVEGMRIPMDFEINDRDNKTTSDYRDGMLCYAPLNNDNSYADMWHWTYTWIGNLWSPVTEVAQIGDVPHAYSLSQNYPNPFNPSTQIRYSIERAANVTLKVYDVLGRQIVSLVDAYQAAGSYVVTFNTAGQSLSTGVYFYRLEVGSFVATHKMMLLK